MHGPGAPTGPCCCLADLDSALRPVLDCLLRGDYTAALIQQPVRALFDCPEIKSAASVQAFYDAVRASVRDHLCRATTAGDRSALCALLLAGASALSTFTRHNLTG